MFNALPFLTRKLSFQDHQIVMIPDPREWTVPGVLFFPARLKGRRQRYVGTKNEFNFTFFNNYIHWPLKRDTWRLNLTMEMFSRDKKLSLHLPGNWDPELEPARIHPLVAIFNWMDCLRQLVSILSTSRSEDHPVISQYQLFCEEHNPDDYDFAHHTSWWIQSLSLSIEPTLEVVSLVNETIQKMDRMRPRNIGLMRWIMARPPISITVTVTEAADPEFLGEEEERRKASRECATSETTQWITLLTAFHAVLEVPVAVQQYRFGCGDAVKR
ncbi:hypothetical protein DFH08DRAFT_1014761 [Mycena albidolilacea]|uniref:Uncharacterized protein n=1 Tax=Mycena albidolilacea TaxID=1033008 RepID=A0AAD7EN41_9AGAR|nr:hypothetical protein DFH08DRAFT_1014761 [Mycena albidolilacea]